MKLRQKRRESADPLVGRVIDGRWIIEEKIGEGGMGAVYRAHQKSVDRTVAIKTLRSALVDSDEFVDRFFTEVKVATKVDHPHCVTILDFGQTEDGTLYLAMEYLDGQDLTGRSQTRPLSTEEIIRVGVQVSSALAAAHEYNVVHRDLKPDNVFMLDMPGGDTFVKVLDFGIAKMLDSNTKVTKTGMIFGTPDYMSPEQCRGDSLDGRSDLYSLGCILYELLGGGAPFAATTPMAVLMAHVNEDVPAFAEKGISDVPPGLEAIIMKLLEKNPDDRFASATEVRLALETELMRLKSPGDTADVARPPAAAAAAAAPPQNIGFDTTVGLDTGEVEQAVPERVVSDTAPSEYFEQPRSGNGKLIAMAGILLLLVVVGGGVVYALLGQTDGGGAGENSVAIGAPAADEADDLPADSAEKTPPADNHEAANAKAAVAAKQAAAKANADQTEGDVPDDADQQKVAEEASAKKESASATTGAQAEKKATADEQTAAAKTKRTRAKRRARAAERHREIIRGRREAQKRMKQKMKDARKKLDKAKKKIEKAGKTVEKKASGEDEQVENTLEGLMGD